MYLVLEYVDAVELYEVISEKEFLSEREAAAIIKQTAQALNYCHKKSIIHRDIKPENILINNDNVVKLIDFGISNIANAKRARDSAVRAGISGDSTGVESLMNNMMIGGKAKIGTYLYSAPENFLPAGATASTACAAVAEEGEGNGDGAVANRNFSTTGTTSDESEMVRLSENKLLSSSQATPVDIAERTHVTRKPRTAGDIEAAVDMWSLGCVLYTSLSGLSPFGGRHARRAIRKGDYYPMDGDEWCRVS